MKIPPRQSDDFIRKPDPSFAVVLIYGPDRGLVRERIADIGKTVVSDLNDPFNVSVISSEDLALDPSRLTDEANAISMFGGRRLVRVQEAADKIVPALKNYLANPNPDSLVVVEGGELPARSSLRRLCETSANAASVACYIEEGRSLVNLLRNIISEAGFSITSDAIQWLAVNLQGDRARIRSEIDKLLLFMGEEKSINLDHARHCCGEAGVQSLDTLVFATADSHSELAVNTFSSLRSEGIPCIVAIRSLQNHFRRLHFVKSKTEEGMAPEAAIKKLQPPVFFKYDAQFRGQLSRWTMQKIEYVLSRLLEVEASCKQTRMPADSLCSQTILGISRL